MQIHIQNISTLTYVKYMSYKIMILFCLQLSIKCYWPIKKLVWFNVCVCVTTDVIYMLQFVSHL